MTLRAWVDETAAESQADADLVARVRAGESALFAVLMRRHNQRLYRAARAILRDEDESEDVMQQAYINAYHHLDRFAGRASFGTWLTRIAVHEALRRRRRQRRFGGVDVMDGLEPGEARAASREGDPERLAHAAQLRRLLQDAIDALPIAYRSVFVLREVEELSTAETAECLSVSSDVVKTRLLRARALLRKELYSRTGRASADAFTFPRDRCDRVVARVSGALGLTPGQPNPGSGGR